MNQQLLLQSKYFPTLQKICSIIQQAQGKVYLVGGCVRDLMLEKTPIDFDLEVYHLNFHQLKDLLISNEFKINYVGKAFGVFKLKHFPIDIALPRTEQKSGSGHCGFQITSDPELMFEKASLRRDFTINAIGYDLATNTLIDPHHGLEDLKNKCLRHTSSQFAEDPLRVLRAVQFMARFNLQACQETITFCQTIKPENLSLERIAIEWEKLIIQGIKPSCGLNFLKETGWIKYFPQLAAIINTTAWENLLITLDYFAVNKKKLSNFDLIVGLGIMCYFVSQERQPQLQIIKDFLLTVTNRKIEQQIINFTQHAEELFQLHIASASDYDYYVLASKVKNLEILVYINQAIAVLKLSHDQIKKITTRILEKIQHLNIKNHPLQPIIRGSNLIALGFIPGKNFNTILNHCLKAQMKNEFNTLKDGLKWVKTNFYI